MKYFAVFALFMMLAIQTFALPAAPAPEAATKAEEAANQPQVPVAYEEAHSGAAKDKRAVFFYTTSAIVPPYPAVYRYSYVPTLYPPVGPTVFF